MKEKTKSISQKGSIYVCKYKYLLMIYICTKIIQELQAFTFTKLNRINNTNQLVDMINIFTKKKWKPNTLNFFTHCIKSVCFCN